MGQVETTSTRKKRKQEFKKTEVDVVGFSTNPLAVNRYLNENTNISNSTGSKIHVSSFREKINKIGLNSPMQQTGLFNKFEKKIGRNFKWEIRWN